MNTWQPPGQIARSVAIAGRGPAGGHEERVVEQQIPRADREQGRRQTLQIGIERRDGRDRAGRDPARRNCPRRSARRGVLRISCSSPQLADARRQGEVVAAGEEVRAPERVEAVPVAQAQERQGREMGAGRLAADEQARGAEAALRLPDQPQGRRLAIVGAGRIRMLRAPAGTPRTPPRGRTAPPAGRARDPARRRCPMVQPPPWIWR